MDLKTLLAGDFKDAKVEYEGHVVGITFDPSLYTPEFDARIQDDERSSRAVVTLVTTMVKAWDITENGEPWPITPENVGRLPIGFLEALTDAISQEMRESPLSSATSDAPS